MSDHEKPSDDRREVTRHDVSLPARIHVGDEVIDAQTIETHTSTLIEVLFHGLLASACSRCQVGEPSMMASCLARN